MNKDKIRETMEYQTIMSDCSVAIKQYMEQHPPLKTKEDSQALLNAALDIFIQRSEVVLKHLPQTLKEKISLMAVSDIMDIVCTLWLPNYRVGGDHHD